MTSTAICDQIRNARRGGLTRCSVIDNAFSVPEAAKYFGLACDNAIYRYISETEAQSIAVDILSTSLAYGTTLMSVDRANDLWRQFLKLFEGQEITFTTNQSAHTGSWWPATPATVDAGILVFGTDMTGCLWVEEED